MTTITFKQDRETKNTIRYEAKVATNDKGQIHPPITTIYVGKFAFNGKPAPAELTIIVNET
jgi:hypothetical protein